MHGPEQPSSDSADRQPGSAIPDPESPAARIEFLQLWLEPDEPVVARSDAVEADQVDAQAADAQPPVAGTPEPGAGRPLIVPDGLFFGPDGMAHGPAQLFDQLPFPDAWPEAGGPVGHTGDDPGPDAGGSAPSDGGEGLRGSALHGGAYLAARELLGMAIRVGGVVVVTRQIGPHSFGVYSGAAAFIAVVVTIAQMGMEVFLIRQPTEPTRRQYNDVFSFIAALSVVSVLIGLGLSVVVEHVHPGAAPSVRVFRVLLISIPLNVLWAPAQARIERSFGFRKMAMLELVGDVILYGLAVPLAVAGWGPYSLAVGVIGWQAWLLVGSYRMARMLPRPCLPSATWFEYLRHGLSFSSSSMVVSVLGLANPVVVGRYFGATGVGYVALAARLVDTIGFAQRATWRLGIVALSKVQSDSDRTRRGVEEGGVLQILMVAVPMVGVAVFGQLLIPFIFGSTWLPALRVFSLLGVAAILSAPMTVQMALLYSRGRNQSVVVSSVFTAVLAFGAAFLFVPRIGIVGYGVAMIVGALGGIAMIVQARRIQLFDPFRPIPWLVAFVPPMLFPLVPGPANLLLLLPLLLLVVVPGMRSLLFEYAVVITRRVRRLGSTA